MSESLYDSIVFARDHYRQKQDRKKVTIVNTLLGEITRLPSVYVDGKHSWPDDVILKTVKKMLDNLCIMSQLGQDVTDEEAVLSMWMPKQMTEDELEMLAKQQADFPSFMSFLKKNHSGRYDGKLAAAVGKRVLT